jgi:hypothetical protein
VEKETTNRFTYPLSARDAKYIRTQEQKAKKNYEARRQELQRALRQIQQPKENSANPRQPKGKVFRRGVEDVILLSQNVRSLGLGKWPQNKETINTWFNAWKHELTQHGLTAISIQETRLHDKTMVKELETMWCRIWGLKPNPQQPWTFWSIGPASKGVAILVNPRNKQQWQPVEVPATPATDSSKTKIDHCRYIVVQL